MKKKFWGQDWFITLLITLAVLIFSGGPFFQGLERTAYDWGVHFTDKTPASNIAIIGIDEDSVSNIGRWPWPRSEHARLINLLREGGAKMIVYTVFFLEEQRDPGIEYIRETMHFFAQSSLRAYAYPKDETRGDSALRNDLRKLETTLSDAAQLLDTDGQLSKAVGAAGNVILAMPFEPSIQKERPDKQLPRYVTRNALSFVDNVDAIKQGDLPVRAYLALPPMAPIGQLASGIGHLNANLDLDGGVRLESLVVNYFNVLYPSLALEVAIKAMNLSADDVRVRLGEGVQLGETLIETDPLIRMPIFFYGNQVVNNIEQPSFKADSFFDVVEGKIKPEKYRDKIVLVGSTFAGIGDDMVTPIDAQMPPVYLLAHTVSSILQKDYFSVPLWGDTVKIALILLIGLYLVLLMPRIKSQVATIITLFGILLMLSAHFYLMTQEGLWIQLITPLFLLLLGHIAMVTKRWVVAEKGIIRSDAESAESNRMLGLSFQGQGQLDVAFDKFRKCPLNGSMLEILYNLGLDFERKRQFNKAYEVYLYMSSHDKNFRDIEKRISLNKKMEDTVMLTSGSSHVGELLLGGDGIEKPKLGRYEIEKKLGKGAMGVVYLGKDPTISRTVAIKTLELSREFDGEELDAVKDRFFREAETAGRLNHPNIVTIYDAGEEHDLAYISMEHLKGHEMSRYTKPDNLLPIAKVLELTAKAADALYYAHTNQVVHRDIKPSNMMYEPKTNTLKITDFGIARITDSSKTKTGMVLGTPSYMSPEQLSGKKVDGRSDLFSLGIMLYQLLTGKLPFYAESMATLMYKIANEKHPDPLLIRPDLPSCVRRVLNKVLYKDADQRYQTGKEFSRDIRACMKQLVISNKMSR